jgi:hypothetical protein
MWFGATLQYGYHVLADLYHALKLCIYHQTLYTGSVNIITVGLMSYPQWIWHTDLVATCNIPIQMPNFSVDLFCLRL